MIAQSLLSNDVFALKKTDSADAAISMMHDWTVSDLPVVESGKLMGYVSLRDLSELPGRSKIHSIIRPFTGKIISEQTHLYEMIRLFSENEVTTLAVLNASEQFVGIVTLRDVYKTYRFSALAQPGAIIVLQMPARNYTLTEISRLVEMNDAKILHVSISCKDQEDDHIEVSLKLNVTHVKTLLTTFDRYQYQISGVYQTEAVDEDVDHRFKLLMHYLKL